jgi:alpha-galactosidase
MKDKFLLILFIAAAQFCFAQSPDTITLKNRFLERKFVSGSGVFYTSSFKNLSSGNDYARKGSEEFFFTLDQKDVSGAGDNAAFGFVKKELGKTSDGIQKLTVFLKGRAEAKTENIELSLIYELYDELPVVRKQLCITNHSLKPIAITNLDVERLNLEPIIQQQTDIYSNYGSHLDWRPYKGTHHDAALMVYHTYAKEGFILGNEAPSVLKRTEVYTHNNSISIGMGKIDDHYPFKKWIEPGETFKSPKAFICMVKENKWEDAFEGYFAQFIRTRLGVKLFEHKEVPFAFYNTWRPFGSRINDKLVRDLADGLEGTGIDLLIMDDGWQGSFGDWEPDSLKFPDGLKPVCDYITRKGMKPGLWISLANVSEKSKVYHEHPEWAVLDKNGKPAYLHDGTKGRITMSLGSGYYDYILKKTKGLIKENNLAYLKIDLAIINSAYILDYERKGDYGTEAKVYKDRASSYYAIYERTLKLMDELHSAFPDLLIDCTYEVWGEYYINDFALIEHADYDWLTNYNDAPPVGPINIRQMSYDRTRVIPAATNLIGNQLINTDMSKYTFLSLASAKPILVGDARNFPVELKKWYANWIDWFKMMDKKYQFTHFTQVSDIFPRANLSNWDGCYKFNKEKQGGVLFFYRNGSLETTRTFQMPLADPELTYKLYSLEDKKTIGKFSGKELLEQGITITIPGKYEARVLGIEKADAD